MKTIFEILIVFFIFSRKMYLPVKITDGIPTVWRSIKTGRQTGTGACFIGKHAGNEGWDA